MKAYKLFFKPDRAVPQFRRLRSHAAEAVVNRLNEDDARVAALKDFGYSYDHGTATDCLSLNRCPASVVRRPWRLGGEGCVV